MSDEKKEPRKKGTLQDTKTGKLIRVRLPGGHRPSIRVPKGMSEAKAREKAAVIAERVKAEKTPFVDRRKRALAQPSSPAVPEGETVSAWAKAWAAEREAAGLETVRDDKARLRDHIEPVIGQKSIRTLTKADVESVVRALDEKVRREEIAWKTAQNIWNVLSKMCKDASASKNPALRVRDDNPALGVAPPDVGGERAKSYLYPDEFLELVSCNDVPLHWRILYIVAAYTYARANELTALCWEDVDLKHGTILVHRAVNRRARKGAPKKDKATKSKTTRRIPLEAPLAQLLRQIRPEGATGKVVHVPVSKLADVVRKHLRAAKVDRAELFASDATRKPFGFHDLRATGITWMALRKDAPLAIQQRAGHEQFSTTQIYLREAENLSGLPIGQPFPALPVGFWKALRASDLWTTPWTIEGVGGSEVLVITSENGAGHGVRTRFEQENSGKSASASPEIGAQNSPKSATPGPLSMPIVRGADRAVGSRARSLLLLTKADLVAFQARLEASGLDDEQPELTSEPALAAPSEPDVVGRREPRPNPFLGATIELVDGGAA